MNDVEEIKNRLDIVEVIGNYIPLKQAGSNYKGLSPFKTEKTPSFMVSSEKGIWHDFSTGQGGDIFSFVMLVEGIEFREALELLAKRAGVELKPRSATELKNTQSKNRLYDALDSAMRYYHLCLSKTPQALEYFTVKRNLSTDIIKKYRLGYSPDSWESLSNYLTQKGYSQKELQEAGLARQKTGSKSIYDMFRGRLMFPVFDKQGRVVGFSARVLSGDGESAKYINTPESPVYHKGQVLYGLSQAKEAIRSSNEVIVVEGNMDVLALANDGVANVVAASGTALTIDQLRILGRLTPNIKLCFDQDSAGLKATMRVLELARSLEIKLMVISIAGAKDPDELLQKDPKAWAEAVKNAQYAPDYIFNYAQKEYDISSAHGKKQFANLVLPAIASLADDIEKDHYTKKLAQLLGVEELSIRKKLQDGLERKPLVVVSAAPAKTDDSVQKPRRQLTKAEKIERIILELMLSNMAARDGLEDIDYNNLSNLHEPILTTLRAHPEANSIRLAKLLPNYSDYVKILSLRGEHMYSDLPEHDARLEAFTQIHRLTKIAQEKTKRQLTREIAQAEAEKDTAKVTKLLQKYQDLINEE